MKFLYLDVYRDAVIVTEFRVEEGKVQTLRNMKGTLEWMTKECVNIIEERKPEKIFIDPTGAGYSFLLALKEKVTILPDGTVQYDQKTQNNG